VEKETDVGDRQVDSSILVMLVYICIDEQSKLRRYRSDVVITDKIMRYPPEYLLKG